MRERIMRYDARHWARSFIKDLTSGPISEARTMMGNLVSAWMDSL